MYKSFLYGIVGKRAHVSPNGKQLPPPVEHQRRHKWVAGIWEMGRNIGQMVKRLGGLRYPHSVRETQCKRCFIPIESARSYWSVVPPRWIMSGFTNLMKNFVEVELVLYLHVLCVAHLFKQRLSCLQEEWDLKFD